MYAFSLNRKEILSVHMDFPWSMPHYEAGPCRNRLLLISLEVYVGLRWLIQQNHSNIWLQCTSKINRIQFFGIYSNLKIENLLQLFKIFKLFQILFSLHEYHTTCYKIYNYNL